MQPLTFYKSFRLYYFRFQFFFLPLRYVFAKSTYCPVAVEAVSKVTAADVGVRVRIKKTITRVCSGLFAFLQKAKTAVSTLPPKSPIDNVGLGRRNFISAPGAGNGRFVEKQKPQHLQYPTFIMKGEGAMEQQLKGAIITNNIKLTELCLR